MPSDYANDLMARVGLDTTEWKKGITDLNAGIKHIETGFQATAALMDDWSNNSEGLKARVESLNDKLAIQKQKLDLLKKAYDEEVAANGAGSKAAEELAKKMYAAKNEIDRTEQSIEKYNKKLEDMSFISDKTAKTLDDFSKKTRTMSMVATGALAAIGAGIVKAGKNADDINTLSKQTGIATDEIQKFQYASQLVDVELNTVVKSLARMTRNMASNSAETKAAWERIGVSTKTASGEMKNTTDIFYETLEALSKIKNETERDQLAMQIFGKSANELAGIVDDGGKSLRELGAEAENLGLVMSQDALDGANEFNDALDKLKAQLTATLGKAFSENADNLTETVEAMSKVIVGLVDAIASAPPWLTTTTLAIVGLAAVTSPLLKTGSMAIKTIKLVRDAYRSKTKATVEDTVAEGAHAVSLDKTAESAKKNAGAMKGIGAAAKSAGPYIAVVAAALGAAFALGKFAESRINKLNGDLQNRIDEKYNEKLKKRTKIYDEEIERLSELSESQENYLNEETNRINSFYDNAIAKLNDQLKAQKNAIQEERSLADKAHKEKIGQLEKERDLRLEIIDIQSNREIEALQKQIDAIDALEAADETAKKDRQNKEKLEGLEAAIRSAKTYAEKVDAEKAYNAFLAETEEEKVKNAREAQKAELQGQIETIKQESQNKKDQVTAEFSAAKELADGEYEMQKESLDKRAEALDSFIENETARLEEARSRKLAVLQKETQDYVDELQKRIDKQKELKEEAEKTIAAEKEAEEKSDKVQYEKYTNTIKTRGVSWTDAIPAGYIDYLNKHKGTGGKFGSNASGTNFWRGGLTQVNEEGGEILNLPRGTQIIPHDVSMEMARAAGAASVNNSNNTTNTTNHYQYGAQQEVVVLNVDGRNIARVIEPKVSVLMSDTIYRRRRSGGANQRI